MDHLPLSLREDYDFWAKQLNEFDKTKIGRYVTTEEVLRSHYFIVDYFFSIGEKLRFGINVAGQLIPPGQGQLIPPRVCRSLG